VAMVSMALASDHTLTATMRVANGITPGARRREAANASTAVMSVALTSGRRKGVKRQAVCTVVR
jgi:hypothetical protein